MIEYKSENEVLAAAGGNVRVYDKGNLRRLYVPITLNGIQMDLYMNLPGCRKVNAGHALFSTIGYYRVYGPAEVDRGTGDAGVRLAFLQDVLGRAAAQRILRNECVEVL